MFWEIGTAKPASGRASFRGVCANWSREPPVAALIAKPAAGFRWSRGRASRRAGVPRWRAGWRAAGARTRTRLERLGHAQRAVEHPGAGRTPARGAGRPRILRGTCEACSTRQISRQQGVSVPRRIENKGHGWLRLVISVFARPFCGRGSAPGWPGEAAGWAKVVTDSPLQFTPRFWRFTTKGL